MEPWYRRNAGIVVFNTKHKVLVCQRADMKDSWQFPQGGIEHGERFKQAATRELKEETSLTNVKHIMSLDTPARYTFPPQVIASMQKRGFTNTGQDIFWSLFLFDGDEPEFKYFKWLSLQEAYDLSVDFKMPAYEKAVREFLPFVEGSK